MRGLHSRLRLLAVLAASAGAAYACSSTREQRPVAALASTPQAGLAFQQIRDGWINPSRVSRAELGTMLEQFLTKFPKDGLVPVAPALLAFVYMEAGHF